MLLKLFHVRPSMFLSLSFHMPPWLNYFNIHFSASESVLGTTKQGGVKQPLPTANLQSNRGDSDIPRWLQHSKYLEVWTWVVSIICSYKHLPTGRCCFTLSCLCFFFPWLLSNSLKAVSTCLLLPYFSPRWHVQQMLIEMVLDPWLARQSLS